MAQELEVNLVTLEDNLDYMIISALTKDNNKYLILALEDNPEDIVVRKVIKKEEKEYLVRLDSVDEYDEIMIDFFDKLNKKEGENEE